MPFDPSSAPVALVTGATSGIGRATAFALGRAGWRVIVTARTADRLAALLAELAGAGIAATGTPADVADPDAVARVVADGAARFGPRLDALINNAGVLIAKRFDDLTLEEWDETQRTNLRALFVTTKAGLPGLRTAGRGAAIVNVASLAGRNGFVGGTAYAASKHAVLGFSRSLLAELRGEGIRVIAICPGSVATPMLADQPLLPAKFDRVLQPEDVAATIVHCLQLPPHATVSELDLRPTTP
jgi:3-oxoacyl-[acyl-carrier protein] reductase